MRQVLSHGQRESQSRCVRSAPQLTNPEALSCLRKRYFVLGTARTRRQSVTPPQEVRTWHPYPLQSSSELQPAYARGARQVEPRARPRNASNSPPTTQPSAHHHLLIAAFSLETSLLEINNNLAATLRLSFNKLCATTSSRPLKAPSRRDALSSRAYARGSVAARSCGCRRPIHAET